MSGTAEALRLFVAVDLPDAARAAVAAEMAALAEVGADVRWVRPEQLHVTLKFVGDTPPEDVDPLREALRDVPTAGALRLSVRGLGRFPAAGRGAPRVFWAGFDGDVDGLVTLARAVEDACAECGVERERRSFTPHLTLGRVRSGRNLRALEAVVEERGASFAAEVPGYVDAFRLYRSELRPTGALHTVLEEYPLG